MERTSHFKDAFSRGGTPASSFLAPTKDRFKEKAERLAARRGARPSSGDAFAFRGAAAPTGDAFHAQMAASPPFAREDGLRPLATRPERTLANGASLKLVASQPRDVDVLKSEESAVERRAAKSSTFVLVSSASVAEAPAVPAGGEGGQGPLLIPSLTPQKGRSKAGGGGGNGGGGQPPQDRIFNQDDLAGVLIVLAVLLMIALYLFRGSGGAAIDQSEAGNVEPASATPVDSIGPPTDPFGNQAVDLTPKSPLPPELAPVEAAPPPASAPEATAAPAATTPATATPAAVEVRVHAYFCTDSSELTPASAEALDREIAAWGDRMSGKDLVVAGYADTRGVAIYNTWLGGERARSVVNYLTARGFTATALAVGELPDLDDNRNCANQRRVDVRLADAPEEAPSRSCAPPPEYAALACVIEQSTATSPEPPAQAEPDQARAQ